MSYLETARASLEALRCRPERSTSPVTSASAMASTAEQVSVMRLDEFARAGLVLLVYSEVLGRRVVFVSDNVRDSDLAGTMGPVYRVGELRKLAALRSSPERRRRIDELRQVFGGTIEAVGNPHDPGQIVERGPSRSEESGDAA